eukprot:TRINITY_DN12069_c0_g2_i8.p1 TRINITY_DN12069_c0_g2~~TRINITY_DN12069_c0_g2_i8.p1  ORF type:complete len:397 (+),score=85.62 TRINITY_DN12069_c0_g2_i8:181-1371(+)
MAHQEQDLDFQLDDVPIPQADLDETDMTGTRTRRTRAKKSSTSTSDGDAKVVPAFVTKLLSMINDPSTDHLISWTENGDTFRVHNATTLAREVLPRYYKHGNFTSLVRQLNMYGFHKVVAVDTGLRSTDQVWEFVHPCVHRDHPELLVHIKRKDGGTRRAKRVTREDMDEVMQDLQSMRGNQDDMATKFSEMQRQNQALWQEVSVLRRRHEQQRAMISKIMMFLTRLVQQPQSTLGNGDRPNAKRAKHLALGNGLHSTSESNDLPTVTALDMPSGQDGTNGLPDMATSLRNALHPEMANVDSSLAETRSRLAAQGVDSNFLSSLWQAAALQPPTSVYDSDWSPSHQPNVHYEPLNFEGDPDLSLDLDPPHAADMDHLLDLPLDTSHPAQLAQSTSS